MRSPILFSALLASLTLPMFAAECPVVDRLGGPYAFSVVMSDTGFPADEESTGAYMGVDIADVTPERLSTLKLKDERGVEVTMVDQDAPAGKAGLKEHDVILSMNGTSVESGAQLRRMIRETPAGRIVTLGVSRDGQPLTLKVQLADRGKKVAWGPKSKDFKFEMPPMPPMPDFDMPVSVVVAHSSMRSGLMVENITPQLGDFFGVKSGKGVLIRSVERGSRAEKSGFRAGDVIVRVNNQPVSDTSDFSHAIRSVTGGSVTVGVIREKREHNLTLPLPDRKDSGGLLEESFEAPEFDAEARVDLTKLHDELRSPAPDAFAAGSRRAIEEATPEIEKAQREAMEELERAKPEFEKAMRDAQNAADELRSELCEKAQELRQQTQKLQKELGKQRRESLRQNRRQLERLRHEMHGEWMQI
jgi:membrane-associated protease RseP (regulator of RpoE activity)